MNRVVLCAGVVAVASAATRGVGPFDLAPSSSVLVINPAVPTSLTQTFVVRASAVAGIGAVSGFQDVGLFCSDPLADAVFSASVLSPFTSLASSDGTGGNSLSGIYGGQLVFPPAIPISYSLDLFTVTMHVSDVTARTFSLSLTGIGGVFLDANGSSLVPFETLGTGTVSVSVVPTVPTTALFGFLGLASVGRRRRRAFVTYQ